MASGRGKRDTVILRKVGNSRVISIPGWAMRELGWKEGDLLLLAPKGNEELTVKRS